jgi:hypothetical protein
MKKVLSFVLTMCMFTTVVSFKASAEDLVTEGVLTFDKETGTITKCDTDATGEIVIPSEIDGVAVTSIGSNAFYDCRNIESIEIPNGMTTIGSHAFYRCYELKNVVMSDSILSIGENSFAHCTKLTHVVFSKNLQSIDEGAFWGCTNIETIIIPNSVTSIGSSAFFSCTNLKDVNIPNNLTSISSSIFAYCKNLTSIVIPEKVTDLGSGAFANCGGLSYITIPNSVKFIGNYTFKNCENISDVYYAGTEEEWNQIEVLELNNDLLNATIHYNSIGTNPPEIVDTPTVTTSGNTYKFDIQLNNVQYSSSLITAVYKDGRMVNMSVTPLETGDTEKSVTVTADSADTAKVFIWGDLVRITPLCESKTIDGQNFIIE